MSLSSLKQSPRPRRTLLVPAGHASPSATSWGGPEAAHGSSSVPEHPGPTAENSLQGAAGRRQTSSVSCRGVLGLPGWEKEQVWHTEPRPGTGCWGCGVIGLSMLKTAGKRRDEMCAVEAGWREQRDWDPLVTAASQLPRGGDGCPLVTRILRDEDCRTRVPCGLFSQGRG